MSGVDVLIITCPDWRVTRQLSREQVTGPRENPLTVDTIVGTSDSQYLIKRSLPHRLSSLKNLWRHGQPRAVQDQTALIDGHDKRLIRCRSSPHSVWHGPA